MFTVSSYKNLIHTKPKENTVDSSSIIVTPQAQDFAKDISVKPTAEPQKAPNITQKPRRERGALFSP